jgi:hypothetical protein
MQNSAWYAIVDVMGVNTICFGAADPLADMCAKLPVRNGLGGSGTEYFVDIALLA